MSGLVIHAPLTIWKYPFPIADAFSLALPVGASVLSVQVQNGIPCLWAVVDPGAAVLKERRYRIVGTGHQLPEGIALTYIATFQTLALVWHLFEEV